MIFPSDQTSKFIMLQKANERKLERFIEFFEYAIYKFSWILNYNKNPIGGNNHTHGGVIDLLSKIKIPRQACEDWVIEAEHGFLHSFCVLYMAYCLHKNKKWLWNNLHWYERKIDRKLPRYTYADNLIVSCLLHDIMRYVYNGDHKNHDEKLINITDLLLPETYTHSNPKKDSLLVQADRLELLRFETHIDWLDWSMINQSIETYGGIDLIRHFYEHIRPVIHKMFIGRKDIWFSHALEVQDHPIWNGAEKKYRQQNVKNNLGVSYYPKHHWIPLDEGYKSHMKPEYEKYFSVHSGKLPISNCIGHTRGYYRSHGVINLQTIKKYKCDISCAPPSTGGRDHMFIVQNQKLPTREWCFLYDFGTNLDNQFEQIELKDLMTLKAKIFNGIYRSTELFLNHFECLSYS